jgi:hypothetical protein
MKYELAIDRTKLQQAEDNVVGFFKLAETLTCETQEQQEWWATALEYFHAQWMEFDAERKELVGPVLKAQREVNETFKPAMDSLASAKDTCKKKLAEYLRAREEARSAALAAVASAADTQNPYAIAEAVAALPDETATSWRWVPEVVDESLIPRSFMIVDLGLLRNYAKPFGDAEPTPVPGVKFVKEAVVRARGRK